MLQNIVFGLCILGFAILLLHNAGWMVFSPGSFPVGRFGIPEKRRDREKQIRRFGAVMAAFGLMVAYAAVRVLLSAQQGNLTSKSLFSFGPKWDFLTFGLALFALGGYMLRNADRTARSLLESLDTDQLLSERSVRLMAVQHRIAGFLTCLFSTLILADFFQSLR